MKNKIDSTTLLSIGAAVLTVAATLVSQKSSDKTMQKAVQEEVAKALENISELNKYKLITSLTLTCTFYF